MRRSMPEQPLVRAWFEYGFLKGLKERLPPSDYEEFLKRWNSRRMTGHQGSPRSSGNTSE